MAGCRGLCSHPINMTVDHGFGPKCGVCGHLHGATYCGCRGCTHPLGPKAP